MAPQTNLNPATLKTINQYKKLLNQSNIGYSQMILFGSQASGKAKPWSDIDLCVVSKAFNQDRHQHLVDLMKVRDDQTLDIEPHPLHPSDFEDKYDALAQEIIKYGIVV